MSPAEIATALWKWTPYLAGGFLWNLLISLASVGIGTAAGVLLAVMRTSRRRLLQRVALALTAAARTLPTFVLLFYFAFLFPVEVEIGGAVYSFPAWIKVSLALAVAVAGFVSDNFTAALLAWRARHHAAALIFVPAWTTYSLMTALASTTGSVVGVDEIVSRSNAVIAAIGDTGMMVWVYLYAGAWFTVACLPLITLSQRFKRRLAARAVEATGRPAERVGEKTR